MSLGLWALSAFFFWLLLLSYRVMLTSACVCRCRFTHDIPSYLAAKPRDIRIPKVDEIPSSPPWVPNFAIPSPPSVLDEKNPYPSLDFLSACPVFLETGFCRCVCVLHDIGVHYSPFPHSPFPFPFAIRSISRYPD